MKGEYRVAPSTDYCAVVAGRFGVKKGVWMIGGFIYIALSRCACGCETVESAEAKIFNL